MEDQVAVYIDFENIVISAEEIYGRCDMDKLMEMAAKYGRCVIKRAYGDWTRFSRYRQELIENAIDLTQLFRYGSYSKKNSADIVMAVDALEAALTRPGIATFVLVTGDSDFSAVARKLREYGKQVIGIGLRDATSDVLVRSCDEFIIYDTLVDGEETTSTYDIEQARQLLITVVQQLGSRSKENAIAINAVRHEMTRLDPEFDEVNLGFRQFRHFLEAQKDLVTVYPSSTGFQVTLRSTLVARNEIDHTLQYRTALNTSGFRLVEQHTRQEILQNLYTMLINEPGIYTLADAVLRLKEQYDAENILRSRDEIQDVARLLKLAAVLDPHPQSWELDMLTLRAELKMQEFVRQCESVYLTVLLQKNLDLRTPLLSMLLYGKADREDEVRELKQLAQANQPESTTPPLAVDNGYKWPRHLAENPEIQLVLVDLANWQLEEQASLEEANKLNNQGLRIRTADFERARVYFLKAAKMMYELLRSRQPGASLMDLEWYLASYCAATAGAHFSRHNYPQAFLYYLAFFALVKETEPVWDKVRKLVPPMLSFYFTIAPNEHNDLLKVSPGRTHPARLAVLLHNHRNPEVRRRWLEMVRELVKINPPLLRGIIQRLAFLEEEDNLAGANTTRRTLTRLINNEPLPDDPMTGADDDDRAADDDITHEELMAA
ncbi:MAG: NYN domain-containing protein [Caldilineaceae bacterium]|nr:NYN domain-containing protein [Caldilineaceae bacterium]